MGIEARAGCVDVEAMKAEKAKSEMESFYLTLGRQVMDSRGEKGDSRRRAGIFLK